jgi:hypothetical protein
MCGVDDLDANQNRFFVVGQRSHCLKLGQYLDGFIGMFSLKTVAVLLERTIVLL